MDARNRRDRYRVSYPHGARPVLTTEGRSGEVLDCLESCGRYLLHGREDAPPARSTVRATIRFRDENVSVQGTAVRVDGMTVVLSLQQGFTIPFGVILREQHYLRRHFLGHLKDPAP